MYLTGSVEIAKDRLLLYRERIRMKETPVPAGLESRTEDYELITGCTHYVESERSPSLKAVGFIASVVS